MKKINTNPEPIQAETIPAGSEKLYLALSFLIPFAILTVILAISRVYPFGGRLLLYSDIEHMNFPHLSHLWHKLRTDGISTWSWTGGLGQPSSGFLSLINPNTLTMMVPHKWLSEAYTLLLIIRISLAGLSMGIYLRYSFRQNGLTLFQLQALPVFSSLYALCAFRLGYFHFIGSYDTIALLPIVMMGYTALLNENKYKLYIISLALAVFLNFYIGMFVCIFIAITFFSQCIIQKFSRRDFIQKLCLTAACSALALGITAVNIYPSWVGMQGTAVFAGSSPTSASFYHSFFDILGNFIAFTPPTPLTGLPNLYSGMICVLLAGLFIYSSKVSLREKIVFLVIFIFLLFCCNLNTLQYIIHGFRFPNMLPSRFTFLISFMLVVIAYRMFVTSQTMNRGEMAVIGISAAVFLLSAVLGSQERKYVIGSAVLCVIYIGLLYVMSISKLAANTYIKKILPYAKIAFLLVILAELFITSYIAFSRVSPAFQRRTVWYRRYEGIQSILNLREVPDNDFYRTEIDIFYNYGQPYLFNYSGISLFSTNINENLRRFTAGIGMPFFLNGTFYADVTPLFNAFFNLRYLIINENYYKENNNIYWENIGKVETVMLMENRRHLPLGFMVNEELANYIQTSGNAFQSQNDLFRLATGLERDLFVQADVTPYVKQDQGFTISFLAPYEGMYYGNLGLVRKHTIVYVYVNDELVRSVIDLSSSIFPIGYLLPGDEVSYRFSDNYVDVVVSATVCRMNIALFEQGYNILKDEPLHLTKFTDTHITGYVTALSDGLLYTSIPYNKNWNVFVDGNKRDIVIIGNSLIAVRLSEGTHQIEFRYFNRDLFVGAVISLASIALFVAIVIAGEIKRRRS